MIGTARLVGALVVALLVPVPLVQARKPAVQAAAAAPDWLREAAGRVIDAGLEGADSVLLHDELSVEPLGDGGLRLTRRQAHRVLSAEGLRDAGALGFNYSSDDRVERASLWNLLPDGTLRRPDPKVDETDVAWALDGNLVDDTRYRHLEVPGCRVGSVVGSEWTIVRHLDSGAVIESFGHTTRPVGRCRLELKLPSGWTFEDLAERAGAFTRTETAGGVVWEAPGLSALPREDYPLPAAERLPRLALRWFSPDGTRGFRDWAAVGRWYRELSEPTLGDAAESALLAKKWKPDGPDEIEAALASAFAFASREVRYVSVQLGIGGFRPATPQRTCSNRYGDCKAKSFLLRSIVERWGLPAYPVLVRTSSIGEVLEKVPSPGQFNHCVVAVALPEGLLDSAWTTLEVEGLGRLVILDATTTGLGPWDLREDDQGTLGLLVTPDGGRLIELPTQPPEQSSTRWDLRLELEPAGTVRRGELGWSAHGSAAGSFRDTLAGLSDLEIRRVAETLAQEFAPGCALGEHAVSGLESPGSPLEMQLGFSGGRIGQAAGGLLIVEAPLSVAPVGAGGLTATERSEPLWLGLPRERRAVVSIRAPEGWAPETLPAPVGIETAWFGVEARWERSEQGYRFEGVGSLKVSEVEPGEYGAFRAALRSANGASTEGVVLVPTSR